LLLLFYVFFRATYFRTGQKARNRQKAMRLWDYEKRPHPRQKWAGPSPSPYCGCR